MQSIDRIRVIGRTYRHLSRYQAIVRVLFRYGFGDLLDTLHVRRYLEAVLSVISHRDEARRVSTMGRPERVRRVLDELGVTFVKLGQILSTRPDLIPVEYISELAKLQDRVEPFPYEEACHIFEQEIGQAPASAFAEFSREPVAAASIAQGHRGVLLDGTEVFVKIQRPGIRRQIEIDVEIMMHLAALLEHHSAGLAFLRPTRIVEEFRRALEREIDFTIEASSVERFGRQFAGNDRIHVPAIFPRFCAEKVLTMEYVRGIKASETASLLEAGCDLRGIAARGADLLMEQFFEHGFFHADPHPGNIYVLPGDVICYVDFGLMGRISLSERERFADLLMMAVDRDERHAAQILLKLCSWESEPDLSDLERDLGDFLDEHMHRSLGMLDAGRTLQRLHGLCSRHGLSLRPHVYLMLKTLGTMDEMGRQFDPDFEIAKHVRPFVVRLQRRRLNPTRLMRELIETGGDCAGLLQDLPGEVRGVFRQIREGRVKVEFEHRGLDGMLHAHERISNRITSAIVLAAMIIGSSLMTLSDIPPKWKGLPILGIGGFVVAAFLGLWLLWSIMRSGRT